MDKLELDLFIKQNKVEILRYLPKFLAKSPVFKATADICSDEHEKLRLKLIDLLKQKYVKYATFGLNDWEKEFDISKSSPNIEDRRSRILLYLQMNNISSKEFCERIISMYCNKPAHIVEHPDNYSFEIKIDKDSCFNFDSLKADVELYKPAHLGYTLHEVEHVTAMTNIAARVVQIETTELAIMPDYNIEPISVTVDLGATITISEKIEL